MKEGGDVTMARTLWEGGCPFRSPGFSTVWWLRKSSGYWNVVSHLRRFSWISVHMMKRLSISLLSLPSGAQWNACLFLLLINPWEISAEPSNLEKQVLAYNCALNGNQVIFSNQRVLHFPLPTVLEVAWACIWTSPTCIWNGKSPFGVWWKRLPPETLQAIK